MLNHSPNLPKPIPQIPKGYEWKVIDDPTRSGDEPGLFYGKLFRMIDLRLDRDEKSTWPDGIRFEHILTGQRLTFEQGWLIDLANQACLNRKSRSRTRKEKMLSRPAPHPSQMRRFILFRTIDPTGVSGTGVVAEGLIFTDGLSILH